MEELTIEQKAQRYDEALNVAKDIRDGKTTYIPNGTTVIEAIFPELKESDNERIRKSLLRWIQSNSYTSIAGIPIKDVIAWLEKQGEQNSTQETESFEAEHGKYYYCILKIISVVVKNKHLKAMSYKH